MRNYRNKIILLLLICGLVLSAKNCSLKAPGITFTQTQTASERQMVGEDKEIEKDGWLISSIKSSSSGSDLWERDVTNRNILDKNHLILLKKLAYLTPELKELKVQGIVGESFDGSVKRVRQVPLPISSGTSEKRVSELLDRVNATRKEVISIQVGLDPDKSKEEVEASMKEYYYQSVEYGEYYESSLNQWAKKEYK